MLRIRLQGDPFGSHQVAVVVVVPARHRVDHRVARLDQCPVGRVDHGPGAARDHDALQRDFDLQPVAPELPYRFAQAQHAVARGIVRLSGGQGAQRSVPEAVRDGKLARQEIAHREIRDLLPRGDGRAYLGGDAEDLRSDQSLRHAGEAAAGIRSLQIELQLLHGASRRDPPI